jgi:hypothetical protein
LKHYYQFNEISADSTINSATGTYVKMVNQPVEMKSDFPFGKGKTTILNVQDGSNQSFGFIEGGLVSLELDSSNKKFPLLITRINADYQGTVPDTSLYTIQKNPYWIIRSLDTGVTYKATKMRLDMGSVIDQIKSFVSVPGDIKVFNRILHSTEEWNLVDTCQSIAFGGGPYTFNGFVEGQFSMAIPLVLTPVLPFATASKTKFMVGKSSQNSLTVYSSKPAQIQKIKVLDFLGRSIQDWGGFERIDKTQFDLNSTQQFQPGVYILQIDEKSGSRSSIRIYMD